MDDNSFQTAADVAYRIIVRKILDGEYTPGMKLPRRKMAEATGVSVIPVIEALKRLEADNLVESRPQWGSFVSLPTRKKIIEFFQVREALECEVARILSTSITPEQVAEITVIATELDTVPYTEEHVVDHRDYHLRFHTMLAEYTGNETLVNTLSKINMFWVLSKALTARASSVEYPRYWHRKLIDAITSGNPDEAEIAMREHVEDALNPILEMEDKQFTAPTQFK